MAEAKAYSPAGIDLGTSTSLIACYKPNFGRQELTVLNLNNGQRSVESIVSYKDKKTIVGKKQEGMQAFWAAKRFIGRRFDPDIAELEKKMNLPFRVISDSVGMPVFRTTPTLSRDGKQALYKDYYPHEVSADILKYVKSTYTQSRKTVTGIAENAQMHAVISIPAAFREPQRRATMQAAQLAGINVLRLIHEPTAAAVAHLHGRKDINGHYIVFDFGGGTHDVSIIEVKGRELTVKTTTGDPFLGGHDIDTILFDYLVTNFRAGGGLREQKLSKVANEALRGEAKKIKELLSEVDEVDSELSELIPDAAEVQVKVTKKILVKLLTDHKIFEKMMIPVKQALDEAKLKKEELKGCLLAGGTTKIPSIVEYVTQFFRPVEVYEHPQGPMEVVALGAAIVANNLESKDSFILKEALRFPLGVDIRPEDDGTDYSVILKAQSAIPVKESRTYWTIRDDQTQMDFNVYEGKDNRTRLTTDCTMLGKFTLYGIPSLPRGEAKVEVTMSLDEGGILTVKAVCVQSGKSTEIKISQTDEKVGQVDEKVQAKLNQLTETAYRRELSLPGRPPVVPPILQEVLTWLHTPRHEAITLEEVETRLRQLG